MARLARRAGDSHGYLVADARIHQQRAVFLSSRLIRGISVRQMRAELRGLFCIKE